MPSLPKQDPRLDAFRDAAMEFDAVYGLLAKSCGLSDPEYWSLVLIKEGIVTQKEIRDQLCLNRQTLNASFKLLIEKVLIRLEPFQDNQRSKRAILTETGQHFVDETVSKMERTSLGNLNPRGARIHYAAYAALQRRVEAGLGRRKNKHPLIGGPVIAMTVLEKMSSALGKS